jgi:anti-sigma factor RsiW
MRCSKARRLLSPYIDKELTKAEAELFDAHVRDCIKCRTRLEEMQAMHDTFSYMEGLNAPLGFATRVMANIKEKRTKRLSLFPVLSRLIEVAVVILVIIIGTRVGSLLGTAFTGQKTSIASSLSLDTFEAVQPNSIGGAYLAMMEGQNEK